MAASGHILQDFLLIPFPRLKKTHPGHSEEMELCLTLSHTSTSILCSVFKKRVEECVKMIVPANCPEFSIEELLKLLSSFLLVGSYLFPHQKTLLGLFSTVFCVLSLFCF